jgi:DNA/RNA endonuclease YhcR with UshA esterase domain
MKYTILTTLLVVSLLTPTALASDDGQTQPRISHAGAIFPNTSVDVLPTTNGVGNIKGIQCTFVNNATGTINIFVNGGSAQTLILSGADFPRDVDGVTYTGWIPFNIRFTSSIRVQLQKGNQNGQVACSVSWGLD